MSPRWKSIDFVFWDLLVAFLAVGTLNPKPHEKQRFNSSLRGRDQLTERRGFKRLVTQTRCVWNVVKFSVDG